MIIGIIGSRRRDSERDYFLLYNGIHDIIINKLCCVDTVKYEDITIVTGDCNKGGDQFARERLPKDYKGIKIDVKRIRDPETNEPMDFKNHRYFDYFTICNIYYKRDEEIAKEEMDYLLALVAFDRKGGTEKTISYFKKYHKDWKEKLIIL